MRAGEPHGGVEPANCCRWPPLQLLALAMGSQRTPRPLLWRVQAPAIRRLGRSDQAVLQQLVQLEKKLFKKSDAFPGGAWGRWGALWAWGAPRAAATAVWRRRRWRGLTRSSSHPPSPAADQLIKETQRRNTFLLYVEAPAEAAAAAAEAAGAAGAPTSPLPPAAKKRPQPASQQQQAKISGQQQQPQQPVAGYLVFTATGLNAHISKLAVAPDWRRRGLARALVQEAVRIARHERRVCSVSLHVAADNLPALALYRGQGFVSEALLEVRGIVACFSLPPSSPLHAAVNVSCVCARFSALQPPPFPALLCPLLHCRTTTAGGATRTRCALSSRPEALLHTPPSLPACSPATGATGAAAPAAQQQLLTSSLTV